MFIFLHYDHVQPLSGSDNSGKLRLILGITVIKKYNQFSICEMKVHRGNSLRRNAIFYKINIIK